ncbi:MAG: DUF3187 family protein [bacterium]
MGFTSRWRTSIAWLVVTVFSLQISADEASGADGSGAPRADFSAVAESVQTFMHGPLRVRNLSPVVQLYGMPRATGARTLTDTLELSVNIEAANNFQSERRDQTFVFFDGESVLSSLRVRGGLGERWEWGVELPYMAHTGGAFDGVVDEFHELFGLPDGNRSLAPRGRLGYLVSAHGVVYADFSDSVTSYGDLRGFVGLQLMDRPGQALALRSQIKFPTGKVEDLSGSEGMDVSVWGEYEIDLISALLDVRLTLAGGVSYLGQGELLPEAQVSWLGFGHVGLQIPLHPRIEFLAQLDAHTDVIESGNPLIADGGVLGTIGGRFGLTDRLWLDLAIIEDLQNESASDVVFQILLGTQF